MAKTITAERLYVLGRDTRLARPSRVEVRRMSARWASMSSRGTLSINPLLMRAALDGIDYVLIHELCHRMHPDQGAAFVELLTSVLPDWRKRKLRLERLLA